MSEVTSVNGQTGAVVLTAADVDAVAESEAGQPNGVATLEGSGRLPEAQLPTSVAGKSEVSTEETRAKAAEKKAQEEAESNSDPQGSAITAKGEAEAAATSKAKAAAEGAITAATSKVTTEEEARKAEVKTEKERAEAAEVLKIPLTQKGKASGVAELNSEGTLPEGALPSSVEKASSPPPTGVAATDTANIQAALTAAAGGVCKLTQPGTYAINETLVRPANCSIFLGPDTTLQASVAIAGPLLTDLATEKSVNQSIVGGGTIDSNNKAQHALWCRYFGHITLGVTCQNSTQDDVILGDDVTPATASSFEAILTEQFWINRTSGTVPVGHYALWLQNVSDCRGYGNVIKGQQTGIRADGGGSNRFYGVHPYGAAYVMHTCIDDNSLGNEWFGVNVDTCTPSTHAGASGSASSSSITDSEILPQHSCVPVSGTNIPANSYVGAVISGTSFTLADSSGMEVKPTGAVSGITLAGVGILCRDGGANIIGGDIYVSTTYGVDNGCYGIVFGPSANSGDVVGFTARGGSESFRVTQAIVGNIGANSWTSLLQVSCVKTNVAQSQLAAQHGNTLNLTNSSAGNFLTATNGSGEVLAEINSEGRILESVSPSAPGLLARAQYAPSSSTTFSTTSTSPEAISSEHLAVSFVAPPSGDVLIRLEAMIENETAGDKVAWMLLDSESKQHGPAGIASPSNTNGIRSLTILVTGLSHGTTYTYDWAWAVSAGKGIMVVQAVVSPWTNAASPATIEVWAA
jgi:hypothetical protein